MSSAYGLYALITPSRSEREWNFNIYRDGYAENNTGQDRIWDEVRVKTHGFTGTQARAEKVARKRIAKMVKAYDMLARTPSSIR